MDLVSAEIVEVVKIVDRLDKCPDYIRASWKASEPNTDSSTVT